MPSAMELGQSNFAPSKSFSF